MTIAQPTVDQGASFSSIPPVTNPNSPNETTVSLPDGTASSQENLQIQIQDALPQDAPAFKATSDVVLLSGTGTDTFVLQISYNEAEVINSIGSEADPRLRLMWLDPGDNTWKLAVAGNNGGTANDLGDHPYDSANDFQLGNYGVDTVNNVVWAVINHNSAFVVNGNRPPTVDAGADQFVPKNSATLNGAASDDGLPNPPASLSYTWRKLSGPGKVTFGNRKALSTSATFSKPGSYVLTLTASDGALSSSDTVVMQVNAKPVVNAGPDQTISLPSSASLNGSATDDGLPNPPGALIYTWKKVSGPGRVTFANRNTASTTASFTVAGTYTLQLSASDSVLVGKDTVVITVNPAP